MMDENNNSHQGNGYSGYVPTNAFTELSWAAAGLVNGVAQLALVVENGKLVRFETDRKKSSLVVQDE